MGQTGGMPEGALPRKERLRLKEQQRELEVRRRRRRRLVKKGLMWGVVGHLVVIGAGWLGYSIVTAKRLPSTSMVDHTEELPSSHILTTPMPLAIHKHMLEHADGKGRPGVIINYNCVKFRCAPGLVDRLATFVRAYPDFVYLAPYPEMDAKIAVTTLGKILVLEEVDDARIRAFIEG